MNWWKSVLRSPAASEGERQLRDRRRPGRLRRRQSIVAGRHWRTGQYILTEIREVLEFGGSLDNVLGVLSFHRTAGVAGRDGGGR